MPEEEGEVVIIDGIEILAVTSVAKLKKVRARVVLKKDAKGRTYLEVVEG